VYPADYAALPAPVDVSWQLKPVSSADSGIEVLSDGTPEILDSARHRQGRHSAHAGLVGSRLVRSLSAGPTNNIAHFGGLEILRVDDLARAWTASMHRHRRIVSIPVPGRMARAFRDGGKSMSTASVD
jgi:hypothetical protein